MPSLTTAPKSSKSTSKQSKAKAPISSELIDDSDLENDEPMPEIAVSNSTSEKRINAAVPSEPAKSVKAAKADEKTSKKRTHDGAEKTNASSTVKVPVVKASATKATLNSSHPSSKSKESAKAPVKVVNGSKPPKKATSSIESSESDSTSQSSSESASESESNTGSEEESRALSPPQVAQKSTEYVPPPGFTQTKFRDASSPFLPQNLEGKQVFLFTAPTNFNFEGVQKIPLQPTTDGDGIQSGNQRYIVRRIPASDPSAMKVLLPQQKKGYRLASTEPTAHFTITEAPPSQRIHFVPKPSEPPGERPQPLGLRMRFMPAGYGEESNIHVNPAVLPPIDMKSAEDIEDKDGDIVMANTVTKPMVDSPVALKKNPKKERRKSFTVEAPNDDIADVEKIAPAGGVLAADDEDNPDNAEAERKRLKKEKKQREKAEGSQKEKKAKKDRQKIDP